MYEKKYLKTLFNESQPRWSNFESTFHDLHKQYWKIQTKNIKNPVTSAVMPR